MVRRLLCSIVAAVILVLASASGALAIHVTQNSVIAPLQVKWVDNDAYGIRSDDFGAETWLSNNGEQGFTVIKSTVDSNGEPQAFPDIWHGWEWGIGTSGTWPIRISDITDDMTSTLDTHQTWEGQYDTAYDIWFSTYANETRAHANGAELMIWLSHPNVGAGGPIVKIDGTYWYEMEWITYGPSCKMYWPLIIFARVNQVSSVTNLAIKPFLTAAVDNGWLKERWYMTSMNAGFELWHGGQGLAVNYFEVSNQ